jgi:hypothetical protein
MKIKRLLVDIENGGVSDRDFNPDFTVLRDPDPESEVGYVSRGRILGRNWNKSLKSFLTCYSQSPLLSY